MNAVPNISPRQRSWQIFVILFCCLLLGAGYWASWSWPLAGDSMLMHYVVFLTRHGYSPYRSLAEINMPLTHLWEDGAMRLFGEDGPGWRLYDFALSFSILSGCWLFLRKTAPLAGVLAATLFITVHLQDGVLMAGQRDLVVAAMELLGLCCFAETVRLPASDDERPAAHILGFVAGLTSCVAACIKPPAALFFLLVAGWLIGAYGKRLSGRYVGSCLLGFAVPLAASLVYLLAHGSLQAFLGTLRGLIAYHATLERRSVPFLLGHMFSPVSGIVIAATLVLCLTRRRLMADNQSVLLALAAIAGSFSYLVQGKGFPYQRYPFLLFLLLGFGSLFASTEASDEARSPAHRLGSIVTQVLTMACSLLFVSKSAGYMRVDPYVPIRNDLASVAAPGTSIQCMDTPGTCVGALCELRRIQATGFIYDCYFLDGANAIVQEQRKSFQQQFLLNPPGVIVVTDSVCFGQTRGFDKYHSWPWLQAELSEHYDMAVKREDQQPLRLWSRSVIPVHYMIFRRKLIRE